MGNRCFLGDLLPLAACVFSWPWSRHRGSSRHLLFSQEPASINECNGDVTPTALQGAVWGCRGQRLVVSSQVGSGEAVCT
jgi:hypothetical protein